MTGGVGPLWGWRGLCSEMRFFRPGSWRPGAVLPACPGCLCPASWHPSQDDPSGSQWLGRVSVPQVKFGVIQKKCFSRLSIMRRPFSRRCPF